MVISIREQWEYRVISGESTQQVCKQLEQLGEEGWEAVGMNEWISRDLESSDYTVLLKRKKRDVEEKIAELKAQESEAVTAKDYARASEIATQIAALRNEAEEKVTKSVTTTSVVSKPAAVPVVVPVATTVAEASPATLPVSDTRSDLAVEVDSCIDLCTSDKASADMKRLLERRKGKAKPLTDTEFVRKVRLLAGFSKR